MKNFHVTKRDENWILKPASSSTALLKNSNKAKLVSSLRAYFRKKKIVASVKIHKLDGKIQEERTYLFAADPRRSKG